MRGQAEERSETYGIFSSLKYYNSQQDYSGVEDNYTREKNKEEDFMLSEEWIYLLIDFI